MNDVRISLLQNSRSYINEDQRIPALRKDLDQATITPKPPAVGFSAQHARRAAHTARNNEHTLRDALIDMIPFKQTVARAPSAYQTTSPCWVDAANDITDTYLKETNKPTRTPALAEAISCIELAREIRSGIPHGGSPLRRTFPSIRTEQQAYKTAIDAFLQAVNQANPNDEIQDSWGQAGMGYPHRKDQLAFSGMLSVLSIAQALCPEPTGRLVLAAARCSLAIASLYQSGNIGTQRVYYKLTDELVSLGLPDGTPSFKNTSHPISTAWRLPGYARLKKIKVRFQNAIRQFNNAQSSTSKEAAMHALELVQHDYATEDNIIDAYKATSYASQIEWAGYRQRLTTFGGSAVLLAGTAAGIALAGGPFGAAAGLALGVGVALPLWAAAHITYHLKGWKAPDNRDKIERALLAVIKSPDLFDKTATSTSDIAARYVRYRNARSNTIYEGKSAESDYEAFTHELTPLLNTHVAENAWQRPVGIRLKLAKKILTGKFALAIHDAQQLKASLSTTIKHADVAARLTEKKKHIKQLWCDLAHFEHFLTCTTAAQSDPAQALHLGPQAAAALQRVTDADCRNLMCGNLEMQMDAGKTAKHLTKGELIKYRLTYFIGSMVGDLSTIALSLPGLISAGEQTAAHQTETNTGTKSSLDDSYRMAAYATLISTANSAEVSAGRARFDSDTEAIYAAMSNRNPKAEAPALPVTRHHPHTENNYCAAEDVTDQAVDELIRRGVVPRCVTLFDEQGKKSNTPTLAVDLTKTEPFWDVQSTSCPWIKRLAPIGPAIWVSIKYLGVSLIGLPHRLVASGISLASTRATRRDLESLSNQAKTILTNTH